MTRQREPALETYLRDINRVPLLTAAEEKALAALVRDGDPEARERMIRANLRLVVSIAKNYMNRGLSLMDLIEEGNIGLLKAVERFNPDEECRFSTYATWWIKQSIRRALVNTSKTVRIPSYMVEIVTHWKRAAFDLLRELGREPTPGEVAEKLDMPAGNEDLIRRVVRAGRTSGPAVSLDSLIDGQDAIEDPRARQPEEDVLDSSEVHQLHDLLGMLSERDAQILRLRFGFYNREPLTLKQIGDRFGLTRERVRQIESEAIARLRKMKDRENRR